MCTLVVCTFSQMNDSNFIDAYFRNSTFTFPIILHREAYLNYVVDIVEIYTSYSPIIKHRSEISFELKFENITGLLVNQKVFFTDCCNLLLLTYFIVCWILHLSTL